MKKVLFFTIAFTLTMSAFAEQTVMPQVTAPDTAANGFGGHHIAYTDNVYSLFINPAAMINTRERSFFTLGASMLSPQITSDLLLPFGDFMDLVDGVMNEDYSALGNELQFLSGQNGRAALGADLSRLPLSVAWVANGFGFGIWNRTFVNINIKQLAVEANAYADVMLPVGFAFKILALDSHSIDAGISYKPFVRVRSKFNSTITGLISNSETLLDSISVPVIIGGSANLGFLYRSENGLRIGATIDDMFSFGRVVANIEGEDNNSYYVPFSVNLGAAYNFKIGNFWNNAPELLAKSGFTVAVDWMNFANVFYQNDYLTHRNYLLDFRAGLEISLFEIVSLRAGISEMLPSAGIGFNLGPFRIDAAYYGKELGFEPGQLSTAVFDLSFSLRPGAAKREWPWTRRTVVGMLTGIETVPPPEETPDEPVTYEPITDEPVSDEPIPESQP